MLIYGLKRPKPILSGSGEGKGNISDLGDNDSNSSDVSGHDSGSLNKPQNNDDIKAWDSANEHLFSVLRLTTTGTGRSVLLKFEQKTADQAMVDRHGLL